MSSWIHGEYNWDTYTSANTSVIWKYTNKNLTGMEKCFFPSPSPSCQSDFTSAQCQPHQVNKLSKGHCALCCHLRKVVPFEAPPSWGDLCAEHPLLGLAALDKAIAVLSERFAGWCLPLCCAGSFEFQKLKMRNLSK